MLIGPTSNVEPRIDVETDARIRPSVIVASPTNTTSLVVSFTLRLPVSVNDAVSPSANEVGRPSTDVGSKRAKGKWVEARKSCRRRLSRRFESEVNISTLTTTSPIIDELGSSRSNRMSPPTTVVVPTVVFSVPARRSVTT